MQRSTMAQALGQKSPICSQNRVNKIRSRHILIHKLFKCSRQIAILRLKVAYFGALTSLEVGSEPLTEVVPAFSGSSDKPDARLSATCLPKRRQWQRVRLHR